MKEDGCTSVNIFNDKTTYGAGLAKNVEQSAKDIGLKVEGNDGTDKNAPNYRSLAAKITADCFVGSGVTGENYVQVFKDVAAACPDCKLYGPDGVAEAAFSDPKEGGIPADVGARTKVTVATLSPEEFEKQGISAAAKFFDDFKAEYGVKQPDPYAIYGYETMKLALDTLKAVGDKANDREAVRNQLLDEDEGSRKRSGHIRHRPERRHHADRLRCLRHQGWPAGVREGDQGAGRLIARTRSESPDRIR